MSKDGVKRVISDIKHAYRALMVGFGLLVSNSLFADTVAASNEVDKTINVKNTLPDHTANLTEVLLTLMAIIALIFLLAWFVKRVGYSGMNIHAAMQVKACLPLTSKEKLLLVQIGDEQVVIGVAPGFVGHIKSLENNIDTSSNTSFGASTNQNTTTAGFGTQSFSSTLNKLLKGK